MLQMWQAKGGKGKRRRASRLHSRKQKKKQMNDEKEIKQAEEKQAEEERYRSVHLRGSISVFTSDHLHLYPCRHHICRRHQLNSSFLAMSPAADFVAQAFLEVADMEALHADAAAQERVATLLQPVFPFARVHFNSSYTCTACFLRQLAAPTTLIVVH